MMSDGDRYEKAIAAFDAINAGDPNLESDGAVREAKELLYAQRMTAMLQRFAPQASEAVRLAVRCQHIRRWDIPRASYPRTAAGYKQWRMRLLSYHAEVAAAILQEIGYGEDTIGRVASLLRKEGLKRNPEAQLLEDIAALVFLEHYLAAFVGQHPEYDQAKFADILRKTARKMSPQGREAVPDLIKLPENLAPLVLKVMS
ncbi:MAG: hypothetical protein A3F74_23575 [Betaproteobacteria bacterium RIFCSPLOWO2_12_FULL_62_58]|nr:MAG: hypothetical protein A3F74_23575 [Betaproteobacteria bacterium RIFCSPLOWO2_12_FULL_62_58]